MDKNDVVLTLKQCFKEEGNCAFIHFHEGTSLLISKNPIFANLIMIVDVEYDYGEDEIKETYHIPYSSISYIVTTTISNLNAIFDEQQKQYERSYKDAIL